MCLKHFEQINKITNHLILFEKFKLKIYYVLKFDKVDMSFSNLIKAFYLI